MYRRPKTLAQLAQLENAARKLVLAKGLLWQSGEPLMASQLSALVDQVTLTVEREREKLSKQRSQAPEGPDAAEAA